MEKKGQKEKKRLILTKETIRELELPDLEKVEGGLETNPRTDGLT